MSVTGVRKAMGVAQISQLDIGQNNCHTSNIGSNQPNQVFLKIKFLYL